MRLATVSIALAGLSACASAGASDGGSSTGGTATGTSGGSTGQRATGSGSSTGRAASGGSTGAGSTGAGSSSGSSSGGSTGTADAGVRAWPDTSAAIVAFSDQFDTSSLDAAQMQFAATHYAGAQKLLLSAVQALRAINPGFLLLHYRLGAALGYAVPNTNCAPTTQYLQIIDGNQWVQEWPGDSVVQASWFFPYAGSPRVYDCVGGHYLTELDDPGWRSWWSAQVIQQMEDCTADGLFADSYSVPNYFGATNFQPNLPVDDATFESNWATLLHDFTDFMRGQFAGQYLWIPNIGSWITTRDPTDYSNVDGAMMEGFAEGGGGNYYAESDWQLEMNRALSLIGADKKMIMQTYPSLSDVGERMFVLGTYLLVKGAHTYLNLDASGQSLQWMPEYGLDLGAATDPLPSDISTLLDATWNVYVRHYANGLVLVNPSGSAQTIALGGTYYQATPQGGGPVPSDGSSPGSLTYPAVTSVTLAADTAAVLLASPP
ncbi:MAG TPA: putative glycoside hydrolase [Myxococcales bacterium]|nr:putative glycoside hydrolase [Myxococcales bacterium]